MLAVSSRRQRSKMVRLMEFAVVVVVRHSALPPRCLALSPGRMAQMMAAIKRLRHCRPECPLGLALVLLVAAAVEYIRVTHHKTSRWRPVATGAGAIWPTGVHIKWAVIFIGPHSRGSPSLLRHR
jgi:hypothetical protein